MKLSWRKRSLWQRAWDPIASQLTGRKLTLNGKPISADRFAKPAARAAGGFAAATVISAVLSSLRRQDKDE
jgi:hypothetical protein